MTRSSLWTSSDLSTLPAGFSEISISSTASWLQNATPPSVQIGDSDRTTNGVPSKGGNIPLQTATLPTPDISSPHDERHIIQKGGKVEAGATIYPTELAPQRSFQQTRLLESPSSTGTPTPASHVFPSIPIPITSPEQGASPAAATPTSKPFGDSLQSLLGINQSYPSDIHDQHPIDLVYGGLIAPKLPPPEPYEFREMTLGCRFGASFELYTSIHIMFTNRSPLWHSPVATDQWLTTRVDTSWTVSQVKLHMLTKLLGARRDQLKALHHPSEYHIEATTSNRPVNIRENKIIATSNKSSVVFEVHESSNLDSFGHSPNHRYQPPRHGESEPFDTNSGIPSLPSFIQSVPTVYQAHFDPETETVKGPNIDRRFPYHDLATAATPPTIVDLSTDKVDKEDVLDELLDRLETEAKERIHEVADKYCLTSFLYVRNVFVFDTLHSLPFPSHP